LAGRCCWPRSTFPVWEERQCCGIRKGQSS
jgi:hypothetical protein